MRIGHHLINVGEATPMGLPRFDPSGPQGSCEACDENSCIELVDKRCFDIMRRVNNSGSVRFEDLFDIKSKSYVVVTFLAILDLAKKGRIKIKQDNNLDGIILFSKEEV